MYPRHAMRTLTLTERRATTCRLGGADLAFLLAGHATRLRIVPTGRRDTYRLTPAGCVGVIVAPRCRLVIRPKVPLRSLFHLLDPDHDPEPVGETPAALEGAEALAFLARRLVRLLGERFATGLHRSYVERPAAGPFLQGRLDVPAQVRTGATRRDRLHSVAEDFTIDVPCNQVPRAVVELLLGCPLLPEAARAPLREALRRLEGVAPVALTPEVFAAADADRRAVAYRPLLDVCRLLAESLQPGPGAAPTPGPAFLLDTDRIFERYVTRGVEAAFGQNERFTAAAQLRHVANFPEGGEDGLVLRPDVTVSEGGQPCLVVDAKWKRLPSAGKVTADFYQVLAYCTALGAARAALVYPGRRDRRRVYALRRSAVRVEVRTLHVTGGAENCRRSLRRLGHELRGLAEGW